MKPMKLEQAINKADLNKADTITAHLKNSQVIGLERLLKRIDAGIHLYLDIRFSVGFSAFEKNSDEVKELINNATASDSANTAKTRIYQVIKHLEFELKDLLKTKSIVMRIL